MVILELSEPFGRARPESLSYRHKLQVVCCREGLHVTVFTKIASLSLERASNCTEKNFLKAIPSVLERRDP